MVRSIEMMIFFPFLKFKWSLKIVLSPFHFSELMLCLGFIKFKVDASTDHRLEYSLQIFCKCSTHCYLFTVEEKQTANILFRGMIMCLGHSRLQSTKWHVLSGTWHCNCNAEQVNKNLLAIYVSSMIIMFFSLHCSWYSQNRYRRFWGQNFFWNVSSTNLLVY